MIKKKKLKPVSVKMMPVFFLKILLTIITSLEIPKHVIELLESFCNIQTKKETATFQFAVLSMIARNL